MPKHEVVNDDGDIRTLKLGVSCSFIGCCPTLKFSYLGDNHDSLTYSLYNLDGFLCKYFRVEAGRDTLKGQTNTTIKEERKGLHTEENQRKPIYIYCSLSLHRCTAFVSLAWPWWLLHLCFSRFCSLCLVQKALVCGDCWGTGKRKLGFFLLFFCGVLLL